MLVALIAKNKLGFINGTCRKENLDPSPHHLWDRCNDSISVNFNGLKLLWDEFASICSFPTCTCDQSKAQSYHENNIKPFQFLMGFNETYVNVRSNLLMRLLLPSLNEAYSVLIQEESQRGFSNNISSGNAARIFSSNNTIDTSNFYSITSNSWRNLGRKLWICQHCKKKDHTINLCWTLHPKLRNKRMPGSSISSSQVAFTRPDIAFSV